MNDSVLTYEGLKFEGGSVAKVTDPLTVEQALEININGKPFTVVMQTPGDEKALALGLLFVEDVLPINTTAQLTTESNSFQFIDKVHVKVEESELGDGIKSSRSLVSVSSCGICGKASLEDIKVSGDALKGEVVFSSAELFALQDKMFRAQKIFEQTGGCHGVAAFDSKGNLLSLKEDVGRHNALDKVVGDLIQQQKLKEARAITFSGRISYEIVSKCFRAKIPIVLAVSAPTSLAVDFAKEYGMTILGFTRDGKTTCYSNPWRIADNELR